MNTEVRASSEWLFTYKKPLACPASPGGDGVNQGRRWWLENSWWEDSPFPTCPSHVFATLTAVAQGSDLGVILDFFLFLILHILISKSFCSTSEAS